MNVEQEGSDAVDTHFHDCVRAAVGDLCPTQRETVGHALAIAGEDVGSHGLP